MHAYSNGRSHRQKFAHDPLLHRFQITITPKRSFLSRSFPAVSMGKMRYRFQVWQERESTSFYFLFMLKNGIRVARSSFTPSLFLTHSSFTLSFVAHSPIQSQLIHPFTRSSVTLSLVAHSPFHSQLSHPFTCSSFTLSLVAHSPFHSQLIHPFIYSSFTLSLVAHLPNHLKLIHPFTQSSFTLFCPSQLIHPNTRSSFTLSRNMSRQSLGRIWQP